MSAEILKIDLKLGAHRKHSHTQASYMDTPASLFDAYEADFQTIAANVKAKLETDAKAQRGGE